MQVRFNRSLITMCVVTTITATMIRWNFGEFRTGSVSRIHSAGKASSDEVRIRREHLLRIRNNSHVIDQEVRDREVIEIDRRLAEIESETVDELGDELFVERLESRQNLPADNRLP